MLEQVTARQRELGARYAAARGARARAAIRDEARRFVVETLVSQVFPAWMGMPSAGGPQATASLPHQPGMYISCSYFLTAALQNAGLVLESRARFAQAPAAWIEQALLPPGGQIHRYGNLSPEDLERRLVELGDGPLRRRPEHSRRLHRRPRRARPVRAFQLHAARDGRG